MEHHEAMAQEWESASEARPLTFDEFFQVEHVDLFRRLWLLTGSASDAEELMQEAFVRLLERWDRLGGVADLQGYLYRTALNLFRSRTSRARVLGRKLLGDGAPADPFVVAEQRTQVADALATLTPRQRAALVLTTMLGYTSEEAARILRIRPATVRALATQGRAALRTTMEDPR